MGKLEIESNKIPSTEKFIDYILKRFIYCNNKIIFSLPMISVKGKLNFSPEDRTKKHRNQSSWKRIAMINTSCDIDKYYAWFLKTRFNLELNKNLRGPHIRIISDRMDRDIFDQGSRVFHGKEIEFFYDPKDINSSGKHWWISVKCPDAENIRESLGLKRNPYFGFHLTIGHANEKNEYHSEYIVNQIKRFGI